MPTSKWRLSRIVDENYSTHFINASHVIRVTLHRAGMTAPWVATIILTNADAITVSDDSYAALMIKIADLIEDEDGDDE